MTDPAPPEVVLPPFAVAIIQSVARQGLTVVAGYLAAHGILKSTGADQFMSVGLSIILGAASVSWSYIDKQCARRNLVTALLSPPVNVK